MSENDAGEAIARRFADNAALTQAVREAVRAAVLSHQRAENPVAALREGEVVLLAPGEVALVDEDGAERGNAT